MSTSNDFSEHGGSFLISERNADRFIYKNDPEFIGRPDGQFMIPSNQMDELLAKHPDDPRAWEKQLGLDSGSLGDTPLRVDVYSPEKYNLREPTADLAGSNDKYVPDGRTSGGYDEGVTNQFPNPNLSGNENIGKISPIEMTPSENQSTNSTVDTIPPDRRDAWPSRPSEFSDNSVAPTNIPPNSPLENPTSNTHMVPDSFPSNNPPAVKSSSMVPDDQQLAAFNASGTSATQQASTVASTAASNAADKTADALTGAGKSATGGIQ